MAGDSGSDHCSSCPCSGQNAEPPCFKHDTCSLSLPPACLPQVVAPAASCSLLRDVLDGILLSFTVEVEYSP